MVMPEQIMRFAGYVVRNLDEDDSIMFSNWDKFRCDEWCERLRGYGHNVAVEPFEVPDVEANLTAERDQLRARVEQLTEALTEMASQGCLTESMTGARCSLMSYRCAACQACAALAAAESGDE